MTQRVAIVTGAARGIGAACALALVKTGYRVVAADDCGRRPWSPEGHRLAEPSWRDLMDVVRQCGDQAEGALVDVADRDAIIQLCDQVAEQHGRLDVVVGAAGTIDGGKPLWQTPTHAWDELFKVNAMGAWNTAQAAIPHLLASSEPELARLVIVTSAAAQRGLFHLPAYAVAKHAALGVVRAAAADLVGTGVAAIAVSPGSTETPMLHATAEIYDCDLPGLLSHQSLRRAIRPQEIAEAVLFAVSPAGAALAGSVLAVEGGFVG